MTKKTSVKSSQICNCKSQAFCGPGFGVNELNDDATSDSACSILDAANEGACNESVFQIEKNNMKIIILKTG